MEIILGSRDQHFKHLKFPTNVNSCLFSRILRNKIGSLGGHSLHGGGGQYPAKQPSTPALQASSAAAMAYSGLYQHFPPYTPAPVSSGRPRPRRQGAGRVRPARHQAEEEVGGGRAAQADQLEGDPRDAADGARLLGRGGRGAPRQHPAHRRAPGQVRVQALAAEAGQLQLQRPAGLGKKVS